MAAPLVRRELTRRPGRLVLVAATVVAAVAFCVGAFGFSQQVEALITTPSVDVALDLPAGSVVLTADSSSITTSTALDDELLARVRSVRGVAEVDANYDQPLAFVVPSGVQTERPPVLRGVVLSSTSDPKRWRLTAGRFPDGPREVAVDAGGAVVGATSLGQHSPLKLPIGTIDMTIVGLVEATGPSAVAGDASAQSIALASAHVLLDPAWAPRLLDAVGRADRFTVIPLPGFDPDAVAARVRKVAPAGVNVLAATSRAAQTQHTVASIDSDVRTAALAYAGLTMLVAALVITNSFSVLVAQRTRELGLLRMIGASPRQLARMVLGEAMVIGVTGAAIGGGLGVVLSYVAARIVRLGSIEVGVTLTPAMVAVAFVVGITTSVVGSAWPAWRAARVSPLEALSDTRGGADRPTRGYLGLVLVVIGATAAGVAASGADEFDGARVVVIGAGVLVGLVGLALLSRWVVVPFCATIGRLVVSVAGVSARLGVGNAARQPSRTAGAASTLMVGLALVATVGTFGASAHGAIDAQIGAAGRADLYVERRGVVRVSTSAVDARLRQRRGIIDLAEVTDVDGALLGRDGATSPVTASDLGAVSRIVDLGAVVGDPTATDAGTPPALLGRDTADRLGVSVGDSVTLRSVSGDTVRLRVVATYTNTAIVGPAVVPWSTARALSADGTFELAALRVRPGAPLDRVRARVAGEMRDFSRIGVDTPAASPRCRRRSPTPSCGSCSCSSSARSASACWAWPRRWPCPRWSVAASW